MQFNFAKLFNFVRGQAFHQLTIFYAYLKKKRKKPAIAALRGRRILSSRPAS
jgi:hypothetical protein